MIILYINNISSNIELSLHTLDSRVINFIFVYFYMEQYNVT
jgi:hypothetical protein